MRIPYGFELISDGTLEVNKDEANIVSMIFDFYMAGASLGKVVDMLHSKQISSPTGKLKWTRATVDHLLSNGKYVAGGGLLSGWRNSWMCNLRRLLAVILTTTRMGHRGKIRVMCLLLWFRFNLSFTTLKVMLQ